MKNISTFITIAIAVALFSACGDTTELESKKAALEKLKAQQAELAASITTLEAEIAALNDTSTASNATDPRIKLVAVAPVSQSEFTHAIDVQGKVDGDENVTYSAQMPSIITRIYVKTGQNVKAGEILAELDTRSTKATLDAYKKQYELVNTVYEKRKELWEQKVGSEIEYLTAKNQKESLEKNIEAVKENLEMLYIKSKFNGTVDEVKIKVGQIVAPGVPCITVVNTDALKIKTQLSESYAASVKMGNPVLIHFPDFNKQLNARVTHVSRTIDPMTRTFEVQIDLPSARELNPNMIAEISIIDYQTKQSIIVPINTIQEIDEENVVFVARNENGKKTAHKVPVIVGKKYNGKAEILSGIKAGDLLITTGFQDLNEGQEIKF